MKKKTFVAEVRARGQITLPKKVRDSAGIEEGDHLTIVSVGDCILLTHKQIGLEEARKQLRGILRRSGATIENLLEGLEREKKRIFEENYVQRP